MEPESERDVKRIAVHEAGHAVVNYLFSLLGAKPVSTISILPDDYTDGRVLLGEQPRFDETNHDVIRDLLLMNMTADLAGIAAERIAYGDYIEDCVKSDYKSAREGAVLLTQSDEEVVTLLSDSLRSTESLLKQHWKAVQALTDYLIANKECTPSMLTEIMLNYAGK